MTTPSFRVQAYLVILFLAWSTASPAQEPPVIQQQTVLSPQAHSTSDIQEPPSVPSLPEGAVVRQVIWPSPDSVSGTVLQALSDDARTAVSHSPVPVLLPRDRELSGTAVLTVGPHWFAASISTGTYSIAITATRVAYSYTLNSPATATSFSVHGYPARVSNSEEIWSVTWEEFGISYLLRIGCNDPKVTRLCQDERYALSLANDLVFVGGAQ